MIVGSDMIATRGRAAFSPQLAWPRNGMIVVAGQID